MSRKEVRRDNPPALFLCPPLSSRRVCRRGGRAQSPPVNPYLTSMRSPGHPALRCGIQEYPPLSYRTPMQLPGHAAFDAVTGHPVLDAHRVIPHPDAGSREYCLYTAGNRPGSRDARSVHPTSNLYPQRSMSSFPLFFSRKRKGKAKRKLPADVRKLSSRLMSES